uniref:Uncharacterized protein n=1 Tax=Knipowitschia caucasica TaxID=637954 RepID=A0AAV2JC90_KNICA
MQSSPHARASPSVSGSTRSSLNDLFIPPSPVPDRSRRSAGLASQDAGSVRTFLAARGVVPDRRIILDHAHRTMGPMPSNGQRPCPIIAKFQSGDTEAKDSGSDSEDSSTEAKEPQLEDMESLGQSSGCPIVELSQNSEDFKVDEEVFEDIVSSPSVGVLTIKHDGEPVSVVPSPDSASTESSSDTIPVILLPGNGRDSTQTLSPN